MTTVSARLVLLSLVLASSAAAAGDYDAVEPPAGFAGGSCAGLGKGFVPVQGTRACVKIGGHVRVDAAIEAPLRRVAGDGRTVEGRTVDGVAGDGPMRAHLRLDGPEN